MTSMHLICLGLCLAFAAAKPFDNERETAKLEKLANDPEFRRILKELVGTKRQNPGGNAGEQPPPAQANADDDSTLETGKEEQEGDGEEYEEDEIKDIILEFLAICNLDQRLSYIEEFLHSYGKDRRHRKREISKGLDVLIYFKNFPSIGAVCHTFFAGIAAEKDLLEIVHDISLLFPEKRLERLYGTVVYNFFCLCGQNARLMNLEQEKGCNVQKRRQGKDVQEKRSLPDLNEVCNMIREDIYSNKTKGEMVDDMAIISERPKFTDHVIALQYAQGINFYLGCLLLEDLLECTGKDEKQLDFGIGVYFPTAGRVCARVFEGFEHGLPAEQIEREVEAMFPEVENSHEKKSELTKLEGTSLWNFITKCLYEDQLSEAEEAEYLNYEIRTSGFLLDFPPTGLVCDIVIYGMKNGKSAEEIDDEIALAFEDAAMEANGDNDDNDNNQDDMKRELDRLLSKYGLQSKRHR